jgi:ABC-type transport system involved in multi-copper enzyme maturation permease subunit
VIDREVKILLRKEWKQLTSSRTAVATSLVLPIVLLLVLPNALLTLMQRAPQQQAGPPGASFGLFAEIGADPRRMPLALLPMLVSMAGIIVPTALVTHLVISERESRTLELLVALPVRIDQLLQAKLGAVLLAAAGATVPLVVIDMVVMLTSGIASLGDVIGLPFLLTCVLGFSTSGALLIALIARDFRTANNVAGFILVPALFAMMAGTALLPGGWVRPVVLGLGFAAAGAVLARVALRVVTFERLMR